MRNAVVYILNQEKQRFSIVLLVITITTKIMFQHLILFFNLIINLRIKNNIQFFYDANAITQR